MAHVDRSFRGGRAGPSGRPQVPATVDCRFKNEDQILEVIRAHLRHAKRERGTGDLVFRLRLQDGGPRQFLVGLTVGYEFLEELSENGLPSVGKAV